MALAITAILLPVLMLRRLASVGLINLLIMICTTVAIGIIIYYSKAVLDDSNKEN